MDTYFPMKDMSKVTLSETFCIVGIMRSRIQSSASGHFDLYMQVQYVMFICTLVVHRVVSNRAQMKR